MKPDKYHYCGLARRLMAIAYDCCLLFSLLFFATLPALAVTGGKAFVPGNPYYCAYLLLISWFYFVWQWKTGRQTLGMRTWRIYLATRGGRPPDWKNLSVRFFLAIVSLSAMGLGFLWALVDEERMTFHDRFSGTILVFAGKTG